MGQVVGRIPWNPDPVLTLEARALAREQCLRCIPESGGMKRLRRTRELRRLTPAEASAAVVSNEYDAIIEQCYSLPPMHDPHHRRLSGVEMITYVGIYIGRKKQQHAV